MTNRLYLKEKDLDELEKAVEGDSNLMEIVRNLRGMAYDIRSAHRILLLKDDGTEYKMNEHWILDNKWKEFIKERHKDYPELYN